MESWVKDGLRNGFCMMNRERGRVEWEGDGIRILFWGEGVGG